MNNLINVNKFAETIKANVIKKVSNCKYLAERVLNFSVKQVKENIEANLEKMKTFFI